MKVVRAKSLHRPTTFETDPGPHAKVLGEVAVKLKRSEHSEQSAFFQWLRLKKIPAFAIPNAAKRSYKLAAYLRAEGLEPGVPDVFVLCPRFWEGKGTGSPGLFIEFKSAKGKLTRAQQDWACLLDEYGYNVELCYSAEEAIRIVEEYLT